MERSAVEARRELRSLLRGAGVCGWTDAVRVDGHAVDAAFPLARVAVLASGWAEPVDPRHVEATARRWTALIAQGWTIVHVTWRDLVDRPHAVLAEIAVTWPAARPRSAGPDDAGARGRAPAAQRGPHARCASRPLAGMGVRDARPTLGATRWAPPPDRGGAAAVAVGTAGWPRGARAAG